MYYLQKYYNAIGAKKNSISISIQFEQVHEFNMNKNINCMNREIAITKIQTNRKVEEKT